MSKLTKAQLRMLSGVTEEWSIIPNRGDSRPLAPLLRAGMFEERQTDVTPSEWGDSPVRVVRHEWRITSAGRAALASLPTAGDGKGGVE